MSFLVLDPTAEKAAPLGAAAPRLATLEGKTVGFEKLITKLGQAHIVNGRIEQSLAGLDDKALMQRLGLRNAWQGETNAWGFSVASLEQFLAIPEARLVVVDPIPVGVSERLQEPGLWQHLPLVRHKR